MTTEDSGLQEGAAEPSFNFEPWKPPFQYDPQGTMILDSSERLILDVRGWGYLTGKGSEALGMNPEVAAAIQDALGEHVTKLLNRSSVTSVPTALDAGGVESKERDCPNCNTKQSMARHNADWACHICAYSYIDNSGYDSPSPAAVTGEWTVETVDDEIWLVCVGSVRIRSSQINVETLVKLHNSEVAQVTARAEAAEAKLKVLEEK